MIELIPAIDIIDGKCVRILSEEMAYESPYCDEEGYIFDNGKCVMYQYHEPSVNWYCPKGYTMRKEKYRFFIKIVF